MMNELFFSTPVEAEQAFYKALEAADLESMMTVWEDSDAIVCIHPLGARLQGKQNIRESWQEIFESDSRLKFQIDHVHHIVETTLAVHMVVEKITVLTRQPSQSRQSILATNIYRRGQDGWYMILHHASPPPARRPPFPANQVLH